MFGRKYQSLKFVERENDSWFGASATVRILDRPPSYLIMPQLLNYIEPSF
jgi:hypothetical protein